MSHALKLFVENQEDIEQLWVIHEDYAGEGRGRKHGVEVLNRSVIVFVTAIRESFIEDLAQEAFDYLITHASDSSHIPQKIKNHIAAAVLNQKDPDRVWEVADLGWKQVLASHKSAVLEKWVGNFNTPKTEPVNKLFDQLLGIPALSNNWHWKGVSPKKAAEKLDKFITMRGDIAHRLRHGKPVGKGDGFNYLMHVISIAFHTEFAVGDHLARVTGTYPWSPIHHSD